MFSKFEPITRLTFLSQVFVYYTGILSLGEKKERMSKLKLRDSNYRMKETYQVTYRRSHMTGIHDTKTRISNSTTNCIEISDFQ